MEAGKQRRVTRQLALPYPSPQCFSRHTSHFQLKMKALDGNTSSHHTLVILKHQTPQWVNFQKRDLEESAMAKSSSRKRAAPAPEEQESEPVNTPLFAKCKLSATLELFTIKLMEKQVKL